MSPRRLTGWEPKEFHEHVYDGDRMVGVRVTREPEWCEADRVAVLAELERRRMLGSHGQPMDEATSDYANPSSWQKRWEYHAKPYIDYAAAEVDRRTEEYRKAHKDNLPHGLRWSVKKVML